MLACQIAHSQAACCCPSLEGINIPKKKRNLHIKQRGLITIEDITAFISTLYNELMEALLFLFYSFSGC